MPIGGFADDDRILTPKLLRCFDQLCQCVIQEGDTVLIFNGEGFFLSHGGFFWRFGADEAKTALLLYEGLMGKESHLGDVAEGGVGDGVLP